MENNNNGIIALVLGVLSIIFSFSGWVSIIGIILGILGIVFSKKSLNEAPGNSLGRAGLITSIIGIILCSILFISCVACGCLLGTLSMM